MGQGENLSSMSCKKSATRKFLFRLLLQDKQVLCRFCFGQAVEKIIYSLDIYLANIYKKSYVDPNYLTHYLNIVQK